ncbi:MULTISPECIES: hypothetical protein [Galbibacter]|uniref:Uncharacterized protein n=1 Tax=Galbibacter pacificus TaxID=2996052 RepID=A0ABT6FMY8_9FLAO|nr:hypothetical protein [Galbibacter pacificus]MDG3581146.1 hypothetical protein [Galbibacter pacificus]MDG3584624.1 hypothetical protein [Galbibacter pacificus]
MKELNIQIKTLLSEYRNGELRNDIAIKRFEQLINEYKNKESHKKGEEADMLALVKEEFLRLLYKLDLVGKLETEFYQNKGENLLIRKSLGLFG